MSRFLQIHALTFHAPSNINRDDTGRPKTAVIGGVERLRISSQAIKRAIRTSDVFAEAMSGHLSIRTQRLGDDILAELVKEGVAPDKALAAAREIAAFFGKLAVAAPDGEKSKPGKGKKKEAAAEPAADESAKSGDDLEGKKRAWIAQLAFVSPTERDKALELARRIAAGTEIDPKKETPLLHVDTAVDIAMFGRMLADAPQFKREAAVQVAHAFATHRTPVESDYYTAMDDKPATEDVGAGFIGATGFGSGVYYFYVAINVDLLIRNLGGDEQRDLAARAVEAFARAFATVTPSGKINSFANHGRPSFILAEKGDQQPRTLAAAFLRPVEAEDVMAGSVLALEKLRKAMDEAYGPCAADHCVMDVAKGEGTLDGIVTFLRQGAGHG